MSTARLGTARDPTHVISSKKRQISHNSHAARATMKRRHRTRNPNKPFTCPFYRRDAVKHSSCFKFVLNRIQDVKQHIDREHSRADWYCARCFDEFKNESARDEHLRESSCSKSEQPAAFDSKISAEQKLQLKRRLNPKDSEEMQWFRIWDIVFPGLARPSIVYQRALVEEFMQVLRDFWEHRGTEFLSASLQDRGGYEHLGIGDRDAAMVVLNDAVLRAMGRLEAESQAGALPLGLASAASPDVAIPATTGPVANAYSVPVDLGSGAMGAALGSFGAGWAPAAGPATMMNGDGIGMDNVGTGWATHGDENWSHEWTGMD